MHIVHLACTGDVVTSLLYDLTDHEWPWPGTSRDARLANAWYDYKAYCQLWSVPDRCERKVFTNEALRADFATLSQKFMRAAAARYIVFWLQYLMDSLLQDMNDPDEHLVRLGAT